MLSTYVNALVAAGFSLEQMLEPQAVDMLADSIPGYTEIPVALLLLARKK